MRSARAIALRAACAQQHAARTRACRARRGRRRIGASSRTRPTSSSHAACEHARAFVVELLCARVSRQSCEFDVTRGTTHGRERERVQRHAVGRRRRASARARSISRLLTMRYMRGVSTVMIGRRARRRRRRRRPPRRAARRPASTLIVAAPPYVGGWMTQVHFLRHVRHGEPALAPARRPAARGTRRRAASRRRGTRSPSMCLPGSRYVARLVGRDVRHVADAPALVAEVQLRRHAIAHRAGLVLVAHRLHQRRAAGSAGTTRAAATWIASSVCAVRALAEVVVAQVAVAVDEVLRRPVAVRVRLPDRVVVVEHDRILDAVLARPRAARCRSRARTRTPARARRSPSARAGCSGDATPSRRAACAGS